MLLFVSILMGVCTLVISLLIDSIFSTPIGAEKIEREGETKNSLFQNVTQEGLARAAVLGALVAFCNTATASGLNWAIFAMVAMAAILVYLFVWMAKQGTRLIQTVPFIIVGLAITFVMMSAAKVIAANIQSEFWASVLRVSPVFVYVVYVAGLFISLFVAFRAVSKEDSEKSFHNSMMKVISSAAVIAIAVAGLFGVNWDAFGKAHIVEAAEGEVTAVADWYHFFNTDLLGDGDTENNFNFGPAPLGELFTAKVAAGELKVKDIANKSEDELIALVTPQEVDAHFRARLASDPAMGAADMAWFDASLKTRYLGEFYDECKGEWASTMNTAKIRFMSDQKAYNETLKAFGMFLDTADKVEIIKVTGGLDDQMYMNPYTVDLVPDIIVMESKDQKGYFLRYTLNVKGEIKTVSYRIDCGFQPTNVSKIMNIPVKKTPKKPPKKPDPTPIINGGGGGKTSGGGGGHHSGGHSSVPVPKDPTKGTDVGPNDNPGPGPDTNNGPGAQYSKAEKPGNSAFMTQEEYKDAVKELKDVAENQKVAGDPNTPSTPPPTPDTKIDSNADQGTGYGGIDVATPVADTHVESTAGGGTTSTTDDKPGTEWGGPPD